MGRATPAHVFAKRNEACGFVAALKRVAGPGNWGTVFCVRRDDRVRVHNPWGELAAGAGWLALFVLSLPFLDYVGRTVLCGLAGTVLTVGWIALGLESVRLGLFRHVLCTVMCPALCTFAGFWLMAPEFWGALWEISFGRLGAHWLEWQVLWVLSFLISSCVGCLGGFGSGETAEFPERG